MDALITEERLEEALIMLAGTDEIYAHLKAEQERANIRCKPTDCGKPFTFARHQRGPEYADRQPATGP